MSDFSVIEWGSLPVGNADGAVPLAVAERFVEAANAGAPGRGGRAALALDRKSLQAGQFVGVVAAGGHVLEILPKIDGLDTRGVRDRLVHMLAVAHDLPVQVGATTAMSVQGATLLDILIRLFADMVAAALRRGMPKRYVEVSDDMPALRGRLDVVRQMTVLLARPARVASKYDEFSDDIPLNRIIKAAVTQLGRMTGSHETRRRLHELSFAYPDIADIPPDALPWDAVRLDRTNAHWHAPFAFARLLLERKFQATSTGSHRGYALLFEMNVLFERFVERMLTKGLRGAGLTVTGQGGLRLCLTHLESGRGAFATKPDLIVRKGPEIRMILDAKWKIPDPGEERKGGIAQADVYQMMAYAQIYRCPELLLVYPHSSAFDGKGRSEGVFARYRINGSEARLGAATIDLATLQGVDTRLAALAALAFVEPHMLSAADQRLQ